MNNTDFDFDGIVERRGTGSYKWDEHGRTDLLPMWVADMDFRCAPAIIDALQKRVEQGVFGYTYVRPEYYDAVIQWWATRHHWTIEREWFIYTSGVVPAISAIIKAMTRPGDEVIVQTPAYNCFYSSIRNNECVLSANNLIYDNGNYTIDFGQLEMLAARPQAKVLLLCNPHNPSGRVWTRAELQRVADICERNGVFVIADEIHCELTYGHHHYTPFASLSKEVAMNSATCVSPSKAFNIAGLQIANIIVPDADVRARIDRAININEVCDVNPFGVEATIAAYNHSADWLDALREYLYGNYQLLAKAIKDSMPKLTMCPLEGTYLAWVDVRRTGLTDEEFCQRLVEQERLMLNPGTMYGPGGEGFVRINLACPRSRVEDAIERLKRFTQANI